MSRIIPTWAGLPDKPTIGNIAGALPLDKLPAHTHSWNDLPGLLPAEKLPLHSHADLVPYTGASGPINLGVHGLQAVSVSNPIGPIQVGSPTQGWKPYGPVNNAMASHQNHWSLAWHGMAGATSAQMTVGGHLGFAAVYGATGPIDTRLARTAVGTLSVLGSTSYGDSSTLGKLQVGSLRLPEAFLEFTSASFGLNVRRSDNQAFQWGHSLSQGFLLNSSLGWAHHPDVAPDVKLLRNPTGPTLETRAAGGLQVMDAAGVGFAPINAGAMTSKPRSSTVQPNTTDVPSGSCVWWHDTVGNSRRFAYNDGGLIHLSPLLKSSIPSTPVDLPGVISVLQHWGLCA